MGWPLGRLTRFLTVLGWSFWQLKARTTCFLPGLGKHLNGARQTGFSLAWGKGFLEGNPTWFLADL